MGEGVSLETLWLASKAATATAAERLRELCSLPMMDTQAESEIRMNQRL